MNRMRSQPAAAALALALLVAAVVAGTAIAGSSGPNGTARQTSASIADFSKTTALKVKAAAVVNQDGTLARGSHLPYSVVSTSRLSAGVYDVRFSHGIANCAWFGTVGFGGFGGSTGPAEISVSGRAGTNNGLFVQTFGTNTPADEPFMLEVVC